MDSKTGDAMKDDQISIGDALQPLIERARLLEFALAAGKTGNHAIDEEPQIDAIIAAARDVAVGLEGVVRGWHDGKVIA